MLACLCRTMCITWSLAFGTQYVKSQVSCSVMRRVWRCDPLHKR